MRLSEAEALELLHGHDHGVLGTLHSTRGVDLTPVVYATEGSFLGSPIDLVKPKSSLPLQRQRNLLNDARATLLVEQWDRADWSRLWWVRAELRWVREGDAHVELLAAHLAESFHQYRDEPFAAVLVFEIVRATGWSANGSTGVGS